MKNQIPAEINMVIIHAIRYTNKTGEVKIIRVGEKLDGDVVESISVTSEFFNEKINFIQREWFVSFDQTAREKNILGMPITIYDSRDGSVEIIEVEQTYEDGHEEIWAVGDETTSGKIMEFHIEPAGYFKAVTDTPSEWQQNQGMESGWSWIFQLRRVQKETPVIQTFKPSEIMWFIVKLFGAVLAICGVVILSKDKTDKSGFVLMGLGLIVVMSKAIYTLINFPKEIQEVIENQNGEGSVVINNEFRGEPVYDDSGFEETFIEIERGKYFEGHTEPYSQELMTGWMAREEKLRGYKKHDDYLETPDIP